MAAVELQQHFGLLYTSQIVRRSLRERTPFREATSCITNPSGWIVEPFSGTVKKQMIWEH